MLWSEGSGRYHGSDGQMEICVDPVAEYLSVRVAAAPTLVPADGVAYNEQQMGSTLSAVQQMSVCLYTRSGVANMYMYMYML